jgi:hypothetical protein
MAVLTMSLAVLVLPVLMSRVGLKTPSLKAAAVLGAARGGGNADEVTLATTAASSERIDSAGAEGQGDRNEKTRKRSFDRSAHDNHYSYVLRSSAAILMNELFLLRRLM